MTHQFRDLLSLSARETVAFLEGRGYRVHLRFSGRRFRGTLTDKTGKLVAKSKAEHINQAVHSLMQAWIHNGRK